MKKQQIVVVACALALAMPLAACGGSSSSTSATSNDSGSSTAAADSDSDSGFDAVEAYWGQWRGSVETTGSSVYGDVAGSEQMLDVFLNEDGTCSVEPLEAHADLLTAEGTWEGTETEITLTLDDGSTIVLTVVDKNNCTADAADFGIDGFDTLNFTFY